MHMNPRNLTTLLVALGSIPTAAQSIAFSEQEMGSLFEDAGAREAALGGAGATLARGAAAVTANPAGLTATEGFEIQIVGVLDTDDERRSYPVHDSFSGYLADNIYALNADRRTYPAVAAAWAISPSLPVLAASFRPAFVADYSYREQILSPWRFRSFFPEDVRSELPGQNVVADYTDMPLGWNSIVQEGGVDRMTLAFGHELGEGGRWSLSWGGGLDFYWTEISRTVATTYEPVTVVNQIDGEVVWDEPLLPYDDQRVTTTTDGSGNAILFGLNLSYQDRVEFAYTFRQAIDLDYEVETTTTVGDSTVQSEGTLDPGYPSRHSIGVLYHPANVVRTNVAFQVDHEPWGSEGELGGGDNPSDVTRYRLGVEHILPGGTPFRFGFTYGASYTGADRNRVGFTAGTQMAAGPAKIDIAGALGYAAYRTGDLFDDALFGAETRTESDRVEERVFRVTASLTLDI